MQEITPYMLKSLETLYQPEEIRSLTQLILEKVCNLSRNEQLLCKDKQLSHAEKQSIQTIVKRLQNSEPIRYIFGETEFFGLTFEVTPAVLIPRPETEEMVDKIIQNHLTPSPSPKERGGRKGNDGKGSNLKALDIGTGSGCIAVTLAKKLTNAQVYAIDISKEAIQIARRNARRNDVTVHLIQADIFSDNIFPPSMFDLIVSNPPYVTMNEKASMKPNVLNYEPHHALFVPDEDPIRFYRRIAEYGLEKLTEHGLLYLEINALFGEEICRMLRQKGYRNIELTHDLSGKERFIKATK